MKKTMLTRILVLCLMLSLVATLAACGNKNSSTNEPASSEAEEGNLNDELIRNIAKAAPEVFTEYYEAGAPWDLEQYTLGAVSYTHLTLPTKRIV